jgi:hypothetical protein
MDGNNDGVITGKEIKDFTPCQEYDGKKITREFREFGRKADINDYSQSITPKNGIFILISVLSAIEKCVGDVESLANDKNFKDLTATEVTEQFLGAFDINNDGNIRFSEYQISNQFLSKTPKNLRQIFKYFDKNNDWVISTKELEKSKPRNLHSFLVSGKRK